MKQFQGVIQRIFQINLLFEKKEGIKMEYRRFGEIPTLDTRAESNETVDRKKKYKQIIEILSGGKELTAREVSIEMFNRGYAADSERNNAAPRLTELSKKGLVEPIGKKKCIFTGKSVAVYKLREGQFSIFDYLK